MTEIAVENLLAGLDGRPMPHPASLMRVAVVDIGTNSTRLLIADVAPDGGSRGARSVAAASPASATASTRAAALGRRRSSASSPCSTSIAAVDRATTAPIVRTAVLTSAVRDAANGAQFVAHVQQRYGLEARAIPGAEEAQLTYLGATD